MPENPDNILSSSVKSKFASDSNTFCVDWKINNSFIDVIVIKTEFVFSKSLSLDFCSLRNL